MKNRIHLVPCIFTSAVKPAYSRLVRALMALTAMMLLSFSPGKTYACYANFTHSNACVGDTAWFYALDQTAIYAWDFGDTTFGSANISNGMSAYHIYKHPG